MRDGDEGRQRTVNVHMANNSVTKLIFTLFEACQLRRVINGKIGVKSEMMQRGCECLFSFVTNDCLRACLFVNYSKIISYPLMNSSTTEAFHMHEDKHCSSSVLPFRQFF